VLASTGGRSDKRVRIWKHVSAGLERVASVITVPKGEGNVGDAWAGQVSGVMWSADGRKVLAAHGGRMSLCCWDPERQMEVIKAHDDRILCISGRGGQVATLCAGDESLKIWELKDWAVGGAEGNARSMRDLSAQTAGMYIR